MRKIIPLLFALLIPCCYAQTNMGPINTPQVNSTLYVGSLSGSQFYPTIQSAVTSACASGAKRVVDIPPAYTGVDPISGVTGGCTNTTLRDEHAGLPVACYTWQTSVYSSSGVSCANSTGGTLTSVTGTAPVVATLSGSTVAISMPVATTSVNGYLSSTDWSTFNGKQAALGFTPYNSTNPSGYISGNQTITLGGILAGSGTTSITASAASGYYMPSTADESNWNGKQNALGFTPYNATNPAGYISSSALTPYALLAGATFSGAIAAPNVTDSALTSGNCVQASTAGILTTVSGPCGISTGSVTVTGSPTSGQVTEFSGGTSITNATSAHIQTAIGAGVYDVSGAAAARAAVGNCSAGQYGTATTTSGFTCAQVAYSQVSGTPSIPTVGTWGALNYPTWASGTPFVKMTGAGTFALDTNTYLTSSGVSGMTTGQLPIAASATTVTSSIPYATSNTASTVVERDGSGNFSAGTITAALTGAVNGVTLSNSGAATSYLDKTGNYSTPAGAGTVTTSGSPVSPNIAAFSSSTAITAATSANIQTAIGSSVYDAYGAAAARQANLSLLPGTYTNGDMCTYASTGTLLNCNTAIPTIGTWGALNYPTWASGTPFVKMTAAGTFALDTNTYGTFTLPSLTSGSVLFSNGSTIAQDNSNFFWDATNHRLGIGTTTPQAKLTISNTGGSAGLNIAGVSNQQNWFNVGNYDGTPVAGSWALNMGYSGGNDQFFTGTTAGDMIVKAYSVNNDRKLFLGATSGGSVGMVLQPNGNVGIGNTTPTSMFNVGTANQFQVTSTGVSSAGAGSTDYSTASSAQVAHCLADGTGGCLSLSDPSLQTMAGSLVVNSSTTITNGGVTSPYGLFFGSTASSTVIGSNISGNSGDVNLETNHLTLQLDDYSGRISMNNAVMTATTPTTTTSQVGFGNTLVAASNCNQGGVLTSVLGCLVVNIAGTNHYVPYF